MSSKIFRVRGQKIMFDDDLAQSYNVPTKRLNEQVRRNMARFPKDFIFQLTEREFENLKSQFATSSLSNSSRYFPFKTLPFQAAGISTFSAAILFHTAVH